MRPPVHFDGCILYELYGACDTIVLKAKELFVMHIYCVNINKVDEMDGGYVMDMDRSEYIFNNMMVICAVFISVK